MVVVIDSGRVYLINT